MATLATAPSPIATHRYNGTDYAMRFIASRAVLVVKTDGTDYTVTLDDDRTPIACTCLGFHYNPHLKMQCFSGAGAQAFSHSILRFRSLGFSGMRDSASPI